MAYEELKRDYNRYKNVPSDTKLVSHWAHVQAGLWEHALCGIHVGNFSQHKSWSESVLVLQLSSFLFLAHPSSVFLYWQNSLEYITMAALSKIFAVATTYPYQVVRARLQDQHNSYNGVLDVISRTWRCSTGVVPANRGAENAPICSESSYFSPQEWRRCWFLQGHHSQHYPGHSCLLYHFCGIRERVCVSSETQLKSFHQHFGVSRGAERRVQTELSSEMIWIWDAFVCTLKIERAGESVIKIVSVFFKYLYVLVVFMIHISARAERTSSGLQLQLLLTVVVSAVTHISSGDLLLPRAHHEKYLPS